MGIYLDHNATTPLSPEVLEAMLPYLREHFGNPSSAHALGLEARRAVEAARAEVALFAGAAAEEVVFTSGGTEANNLAILGVTRALPERRHLVTSTVEHPATREPCRWLAERGHEVSWVSVDPDGRVHEDAIAEVLRSDTALITVMHANNETGSLMPIRAIAELAHARGVLVHSDAAQSAGKLPIDDLGADLVSIAGHKLGAPKGVGALVVKAGTPLGRVLHGADHEHGRRPGTENVASIVGLGRAATLAHSHLGEHTRRLTELRDGLWWRLCAGIRGLRLFGHVTERLPNTLFIGFPGVRGADVLDGAPEIAASTGSACHDGSQSSSAVLLAMGIPPRSARGAVRLSLGATTTEQDVEAAAAALIRSHRSLVATD